jgi:hypothetical protein
MKVYRCPTCDTVYNGEPQRCMDCGLPGSEMIEHEVVHVPGGSIPCPPGCKIPGAHEHGPKGNG